MASWGQFASVAPRLATQVRTLFEQPAAGESGPGRCLGYLATVRADGGPRVHPVAPVISGDGLFCFVVPSPKRHDLERDGRYALHAYPPEESNDEAYLAGTAAPVTDPAQVDALARRFQAAPEVDWRLFELSVDVAMLGRAGPVYHIWRDQPGQLAGRRFVRTTRLTLDLHTRQPPPGEES